MKLHEHHITGVTNYITQGKPEFILCAVLGNIVRWRKCLRGQEPKIGHEICSQIRAEILFIRGMSKPTRRDKITSPRPRYTDGIRKSRSEVDTQTSSRVTVDPTEGLSLAECLEIVDKFRNRKENK